MTGEWLSYCAACPVPEIANVFNRAGIDFHQITGMLHDDPICWTEVDAWIEAARVAHTMFHNRLGLMGIITAGCWTSIPIQHCNALHLAGISKSWRWMNLPRYARKSPQKKSRNEWRTLDMFSMFSQIVHYLNWSVLRELPSPLSFL